MQGYFRPLKMMKGLKNILCRTLERILLYWPHATIPYYRTGENQLLQFSARNYRPCFRENQPKRSFSIKWKRAFWACFRENWVYKFGHCCILPLVLLVVEIVDTDRLHNIGHEVTQSIRIEQIKVLLSFHGSGVTGIRSNFCLKF